MTNPKWNHPWTNNSLARVECETGIYAESALFEMALDEHWVMLDGHTQVQYLKKANQSKKLLAYLSQEHFSRVLYKAQCLALADHRANGGWR